VRPLRDELARPPSGPSAERRVGAAAVCQTVAAWTCDFAWRLSAKNIPLA